MTKTTFIAIDHVQLAMPPSQEEKAREFYCGILRMSEIPKPPELAQRGGAWFSSGSVQLHLGVENDFRPAKKAHPALRCSEYDLLLAQLRQAGVEVREDHARKNARRAYVDDPFGNRIELIESE